MGLWWCEVGSLPAIVALGKFDALHIGHRYLASTAAAMGGQPWLISFSGMAQVMGSGSTSNIVVFILFLVGILQGFL